MLRLFRSLFSNPAYDSNGRFRYLLSRDSSAAACELAGVPSAVTEKALRIFCDAFDIPDEQRFCLRPSDGIDDIYRAMVRGPGDDLECERLRMNLEDLIGRKLSEKEMSAIATIEDLARFIHANVPL